MRLEEAKSGFFFPMIDGYFLHYVKKGLDVVGEAVQMDTAVYKRGIVRRLVGVIMAAVRGAAGIEPEQLITEIADGLAMGVSQNEASVGCTAKPFCPELFIGVQADDFVILVVKVGEAWRQ